MGGFNKLTDLAQQLAGKDQGKKDQQQQQQDSSTPQTATTTTTNDQEWADVGSAAKKAFDGFQADQAGGKGPDYTEIGDVARRAFTAYNHGGGGEEGKKDIAEIGKGIAAGFGGGSEKTKEERKLGGTDGKLEAGEEIGGGERESQGEEKKQTNVQGDDGLAVSKSNAGVTTGLASKTLSGGNLDSSTEKKGLNSHTKREVGDGIGLEKSGLGEDEGVFTGDEERRTDVTRSGETTTSGQELDRSGQQPVGVTGDEEEIPGNQPVKKWIE